MTQTPLFPTLNCTTDFRNRWIAASCLQKSVRRSHWALAEAAALYLYEHHKQTLYRRLLVTAVEDVGVGDLEATEFSVRMAASAADRKQHGGNLQACLITLRGLCEAPKDRSTDLLAYAIQYALRP